MFVLSLLVASVLSLTACGPQQMADFDPHARFQNQVVKRQAMAKLVPGASLDATDRAVVADLAREHLRRGAGQVLLRVPAAATEFGEQVAAALRDAGVDGSRIETTGQPPAKTDVEIMVPVWVAEVPDCGSWPERINPDFTNRNTANFGCAVTRNIGLMVSNPADLVRAREATPRSGARADDVLTKYGEGKPTASKQEEAKPNATLSTVGTK